MNIVITRSLPPYDPDTVRQEWKFIFFESHVCFTFRLASYVVVSRKSNKARNWFWGNPDHPDAQKLREEPFLSDYSSRDNYRADAVPLPDDVVQEAKQQLIKQIEQTQVKIPHDK